MSIIVSAITALLAFLLAFPASRLVNEKYASLVRSITLLIGFLATLATIYKVIFRFFTVIPVGEVGVVEILGKVSESTLNSGVHFVNPLGEVTNFSTRLVDLKEELNVTSKEGLSFQIDVSLQYRIDPEKASLLYQTVGDNIQEIIIPRFRSSVRQIIASYPLQSIYSAKRSEVTAFLAQDLDKQLNSLGIIVDEVLLRNVILPEKIQASIQEKLTAEQESEKLEFEIEQAQKEAEKKKIEAQGTAEAQKILAQGLTDRVLQLKSIEATQKLAESQNSKIIILGGGQENFPFIFQDSQK